MEAQAMAQTGDNRVESVSSVYQHGSPFSETSSWTGLVDLDTAGVHSVAGNNNSAEISEEHVVIHLKPEEDWDQSQNGLETFQHRNEEEEQPVVTDSPKISAPESLGGSAQEEDDYFEGSDTPTLSTTASPTPQTPTSNSVLADIVESLMRPFKYWNGGEEVEERQKETLPFEEPAGEDRVQMESTRNLSSTKSGGNKAHTDNAIKEHTSHTLSFWPPMTGVQSPHEGLSEQEKEATPPIPQEPMVHKTDQNDSMMLPVPSNPPSAANGMILCV